MLYKKLEEEAMMTTEEKCNINNNEQLEEMEILWKATLAGAMSSIWSNMQKVWEKESLGEFLQCKNNWRKSDN